VIVYQDDSHWSGGERAVGRHGNTLGPALAGVTQHGLANPPNGGGWHAVVWVTLVSCP
jgi:hypothetical protein